ncbi:hypothetical protein [Acidiluteibacter ferrifornacis]|uniref:DUF4421 domain-containing protein n=1 Tax=Acidiluteibacter ferrifornacis TaxID=2692424 RepID=A0A6N9NKK9_9FLAO|nr:hypothetical protein [Acidiluteibacter ferrifornacis]MBR9832318.1 hypothetical protein [bacterium]NBG66389.1 hypothetical protein [Acidiluteibacter ferrifornacis]
MKNLLLASLVVIQLFSNTSNISAQEANKVDWNLRKSQLDIKNQKGNFYFYWGYNRATYAKSDIHLKGPDYDFILSDVTARDMPEEFSSVYFDPGQITIPQFNFRVGYHLSDKYALAVGWDHMKYRTRSGQPAIITGRIDASASPIYAGYYNHDKIIMDEWNLVKMEHSDGFNVINVNVERNDYLLTTNDQNLALSVISGAGAGIAFPWTNSRIFGVRNDDRPKISGLGAHIYGAAQATVYKRFFLRLTLQGGFQNMWAIATVPKGDKSAHAEQTIFYYERSLVLGYNFRLYDKKQ